MYPPLPDDGLIMTEDIVVLALDALIAGVIFALFKPRLAGFAAWIPFVLVIGQLMFVVVSAVAELKARQTGRWGELKRTLASLEHTVAKYETEHGPIDTQDEANLFNRQYAQPFSFAPDGPEVRVVYRWWWRHVTVIWGRGRSVAFDSDSMRTLYVD